MYFWLQAAKPRLAREALDRLQTMRLAEVGGRSYSEEVKRLKKEAMK